ncbi:MAG: hypothetical protein WBG48_07670 [Pricia sp.]
MKAIKIKKAAMTLNTRFVRRLLCFLWLTSPMFYNSNPTLFWKIAVFASFPLLVYFYFTKRN